MSSIAAFFDIDGTIYRNSLLIEHFRKLVNYEIADTEMWYTKLRPVYTEWEKRYGEYDDYIETLSNSYIKNLIGVDKAFMEYIADQVIKNNGDIIYNYSRNRLNWHKDMGHCIFFISGSPDFLVSRMAKKYKATAYRGTVYEIDTENKFTGQVVPMWDSKSKRKALDELIDQYDISMNFSYAYGDTAGDLSMLQSVGNPIAINPSKELFEMIKNDSTLKNRAKVIVERKNVVYSLDANTNILNI